MKFPYIHIAKGKYRPVLPFTISYNKGTPIKYFALVDSGADKTYIASELASVIGISDLKTGRKESVSGINGAPNNVYFHPVTINIGGWDFDIEAGFMEGSNLTSNGYGILGQIGLFDNCIVKFNFRKLEMEITPIPSDFKKK